MRLRAVRGRSVRHRLEPGGWLLHLLNPTGLYAPAREQVPAGPITVLLQNRPIEVRSLRTATRLEVVQAAAGWTIGIASVEQFEALAVGAGA